MGYSADFQRLLDEFGERKLTAGSFMKNTSLEKWEERRRFVAQAIDRPGRILDVGCANGFLLRCLMEWSPHALVPYGIEPRREHQEFCRTHVFPAYPDHFAMLPLAMLQPDTFAVQFELVYWNVWQNFFFDVPEKIAQLGVLRRLARPDGRLVVAFYCESSEDETRAARKLEQLQGLGLKSDVIRNPHGRELVAVIDNPRDDAGA